MALKKIKIENFKCFKNFELEFNSGVNILVGDNEAGKSTILEAIHLALTGMINGKYLNTELTQYLFNNDTVNEYLAKLNTDTRLLPPQIKIELFYDECDEICNWMGAINTDEDKNAHGLTFIISLDDGTGEYEELVKSGNVKTLPIEYYDAKWITFADKFITVKSIPLKSAIIDSTHARYQNGSDIYISRIVKNSLEPFDVVSIAQAHRKLRENFMLEPSVQVINQKIQSNVAITNREISLSVELLSKNAWENSSMTYVDKVPFHYIGKGEQCVIKTRLALADKKAKNASVILMEEPENHLTHARLNQLLDNITSECEGRQIIISTHSSFVANKLGLEYIILLSGSGKPTRFSDLTPDTSAFFKKLPGYDTLRLVLSRSAIIVEGPSDELVVQKAYKSTHRGRIPISDGIDVISVGTSFLRFLEIADRLKIRVAVITDNDGDIDALAIKYKDYIDTNKKENILISYDKNDLTPANSPIPGYNYNTLENLVLSANGLAIMSAVLKKEFESEDELRKHMNNHKTDCALSIYEYEKEIKIPGYIEEALNHVDK